MPEQSSMHFCLTWAKERIDEMDAALASLEVKANQAKAASKVKGEQQIADLKKRREEFQATLKAQAEAGEAASARAACTVRLAFRSVNDVGIRVCILSRLNGWPMRSPADASPMLSRACTRGSGPMCGSLFLHRSGLAPPTPCRSPGALTVIALSGMGMT